MYLSMYLGFRTISARGASVVALAGRVAWSCTGGSLVKVGAEALDDVGADVLPELDNAPVEVAGYSPLDLGCARSVRPVLHESLGVCGVALCSTGLHQPTSLSQWADRSRQDAARSTVGRMRDNAKVGFRETHAGEKTRDLFAAKRAAESLGVQEQMLAEMLSQSKVLVRQTELLEYIAGALRRMESKV